MKNLNTILLTLGLLCPLFPGVASAGFDTSAAEALPDPYDAFSYRLNNNGEGIPVYVTHTPGKWVVKEDTAQVDLTDENVELLFVDIQKKLVWSGVSGINNSDKVACTTKDSRKTKGYSFCHTNLMVWRNKAMMAAANVFMGALSFGILPAVGGYGYQVEFDPDVMKGIAREAGVLEYARSVFDAKQLAEYKKAWERATNITMLQSFIYTYSAKRYDPEELLPQANKKLRDLRYVTAFNSIDGIKAAKMFQSEWQDYDPDHLIEKAQEKELAYQRETEAALKAAEADRQTRAIEEEKQLSKRNASVIEFRKKIAVGNETFCGAVVELRLPMVKIALNKPLSGYPGELWIRLNDVYPGDLVGCRNSNNQLTPTF